MIDKPKFLKVEEDLNFVRDTGSNAILATNLKEKKAFLEKQKQQQNISKIGDMNNRIENLENNIQEIKDLLKMLINNNSTS